MPRILGAQDGDVLRGGMKSGRVLGSEACGCKSGPGCGCTGPGSVGALTPRAPAKIGAQAGQSSTRRQASSFSLHDPGSGHPTTGKPLTQHSFDADGGDFTCNLGDWDVQGADVGDFGQLDLVMLDFMTTYKIPNGALCVVQADGRLVYCKGFTLCSLLSSHGERIIRTNPHTRFRICSLSKVITAAATMAAVEDGNLGPDGVKGPVFYQNEFVHWVGSGWLSARDAEGDVSVPELRNVTIRNLLTMSGGWVEDADSYPVCPYAGPASPNWMPDNNDVFWAELLNGGRTPIDAASIRLGMNAIHLTWDPQTGDHWTYNNYGWSLLGAVLTAATGEDYATYAQERVWARIGAPDSQIGSTTTRAAREVRYYGELFPDEISTDSSKGMAANVNAPFDCWPDVSAGTPVDCRATSTCPHTEIPCGPAPYCGFRLENSPSGSGWISSVYDWALLMKDLFGSRSVVLSKESVTQMLGGDAIPTDDYGNLQYYAWAESGGALSKAGDLDGSIAWAYNAGRNGVIDLGSGLKAFGASNVFFFNRNNAAINSSVAPAPTAKQSFIALLQERIAELVESDRSTEDLWGEL